jgi:hypothetical protein
MGWLAGWAGLAGLAGSLAWAWLGCLLGMGWLNGLAGWLVRAGLARLARWAACEGNQGIRRKAFLALAGGLSSMNVESRKTQMHELMRRVCLLRLWLLFLFGMGIAPNVFEAKLRISIFLVPTAGQHDGDDSGARAGLSGWVGRLAGWVGWAVWAQLVLDGWWLGLLAGLAGWAGCAQLVLAGWATASHSQPDQKEK